MAIKNEYGWKFTDKNDGSFRMKNPVMNSRMYFPLCNNKLKAYVTPELKGDILLDFHRYLTIPKSTEDLHHSKDGRNVWLRIKNKGVWSCVGASSEHHLKSIKGLDDEEVEIHAGIGWIRISRTCPEYKIRADLTIFIPSNDDTVELVKVGQQIIERSVLTEPLTPFWIYGFMLIVYFLICFPISLGAKVLERKLN